MCPVASLVPRLTMRIATSGTRKKAPSQRTPGRTNTAPPKRIRRWPPERRPPVAASVATVRSAADTSAIGLRSKRVPALRVLVQVGTLELDELGQLGVHRGRGVEVRVGEEVGI